jgi:hypothetical protein
MGVWARGRGPPAATGRRAHTHTCVLCARRRSGRPGSPARNLRAPAPGHVVCLACVMHLRALCLRFLAAVEPLDRRCGPWLLQVVTCAGCFWGV